MPLFRRQPLTRAPWRGYPFVTPAADTLPEPQHEPTRDRSRDKALLIGIEYAYPAHDVPVIKGVGQVKQLRNVHRDTKALREYLIKVEAYLPTNVVALLDDNKDSSLQPTKENIVSRLCRS